MRSSEVAFRVPLDLAEELITESLASPVMRSRGVDVVAIVEYVVTGLSLAASTVTIVETSISVRRRIVEKLIARNAMTDSGEDGSLATLTSSSDASRTLTIGHETTVEAILKFLESAGR